jgi:Sulfite exporter TauE/SafE
VIAAIGLGLLIGVLLGLLGGGGSILAVPAPVYGAAVPLAEAVPMSLLVVGISSAAALPPRLRHGKIRWAVAGIFGAAGAGAAFAGAAVNRLLDPRLVLIRFAGLMVLAAVRVLREQTSVGGDCALPGGGVNWRGCLPEWSAPEVQHRSRRPSSPLAAPANGPSTAPVRARPPAHPARTWIAGDTLDYRLAAASALAGSVPAARYPPTGCAGGLPTSSWPWRPSSSSRPWSIPPPSARRQRHRNPPGADEKPEGDTR